MQYKMTYHLIRNVWSVNYLNKNQRKENVFAYITFNQSGKIQIIVTFPHTIEFYQYFAGKNKIKRNFSLSVENILMRKVESKGYKLGWLCYTRCFRGSEHICLGYKSNLRLYDRKFSSGVKSHLSFDLELVITFLILTVPVVVVYWRRSAEEDYHGEIWAEVHLVCIVPRYNYYLQYSGIVRKFLPVNVATK